MASAAAINAFTKEAALAIVGVSRSGGKFGNLARRELARKGYRVYPIHPSATDIEGVPCYRSFAALPEHVDAVLVVVPPAEAKQVVAEAAAAGIHRVWLQQGAESPEVLEACRGLGLDVVSGECILMFSHPTSYHKVHRVIWKMLGKLPAGT
jgi:predicted CoA-binding protein